MKLQKVVSAIIHWRLDSSLFDMWLAFDFAEISIRKNASLSCLTARSCVYWMNELTKIDKRLAVFLQRVSIACYAERCISYDRFCLTDRLTV